MPRLPVKKVGNGPIGHDRVEAQLIYRVYTVPKNNLARNWQGLNFPPSTRCDAPTENGHVHAAANVHITGDVCSNLRQENCPHDQWLLPSACFREKIMKRQGFCLNKNPENARVQKPCFCFFFLFFFLKDQPAVLEIKFSTVPFHLLSLISAGVTILTSQSKISRQSSILKFCPLAQARLSSM